MYQKPFVRSESIGFLQASGQYVFELTPQCPGLFNRGVTVEDGGFAYCLPQADPSFEIDVTCANIPGTFHVVFGAGSPGGGLSCGQGESSFIDPILSVSPELPENCIITEFVFEGSFDECEVRGG